MKRDSLAKDSATVKNGLQEANKGRLHSYIDMRDERGSQATERLAIHQDGKWAKQTPGCHRPKPGDLVLVRDFQQAKDHGRKLHAQWSSSRLL